VKSLWWVRGGAGEGRELMGLGQDAEVYVWDVGERKCVKRWQDDGGFGSRVIAGDQGGKYLAIGWVWLDIAQPFILICLFFQS
jgi:U3 small nucleolar RNA-associated protein 18